MNNLRLRYLAPMILIALCLILLCGVMAGSLFSQQSSITRLLRESLESHRAALELEECLTDIIMLENDQVESVSVLHRRAEELMRLARVVADQPKESEYIEQAEIAYNQYLSRWKNLPPITDANHEAQRKETTKFLENQVLQPCQQFKSFNAERIEQSSQSHELALQRMVWGLAGIGGLGITAGLVLGFGVARGLSKSIRKLHVQLRDVAGQMNPKDAELVITEQGDFQTLQAEVDRLAGRVVNIVEELHHRELEITRAEQLAAVGQLAAGVAHEIRNPLTAIKMLVQIAEGEPTKLTGEDLRIIETEIRRVEQSLQTFLDFARPPRLVRNLVKLDELILSVVSLIRGRADQQHVSIVQQISPEIKPIMGDPVQLRQVILNLCMNALDVMPMGGTLKLTVGRWVDDRISISVVDTGPGIPRELFTKLFQPFASSKDTGLGLGLVISKRIIENHGGSIAAANTANQGATFTVSLPA